MVALDTSSTAAYLAGDVGPDTNSIDDALRLQQAVLPQVVVAELLSDPARRSEFRRWILSIPRLDIIEGYWERAGDLRAGLRARGLKAKLADTLIAQSCLDHNVPLITRDRDFRHFARYAGLRLE